MANFAQIRMKLDVDMIKHSIDSSLKRILRYADKDRNTPTTLELRCRQDLAVSDFERAVTITVYP